jgi:hypothetical protein
MSQVIHCRLPIANCRLPGIERPIRNRQYLECAALSALWYDMRLVNTKAAALAPHSKKTKPMGNWKSAMTYAA